MRENTGSVARVTAVARIPMASAIKMPAYPSELMVPSPRRAAKN